MRLRRGDIRIGHDPVDRVADHRGKGHVAPARLQTQASHLILG